MQGAAGAASFSDARLKQNIERLSVEAIPGVPLATWEWKHQPGTRHVGVIAQDLAKVAPELVGTRDGFLTVDYAGLAELARGGA